MGTIFVCTAPNPGCLAAQKFIAEVAILSMKVTYWQPIGH